MKIKRLMLLPLLALILGGCTSNGRVINFDDLDENTINSEQNSGVLGEFDLVSPHNGIVVEKAPTFSWEASENAVRYTLELSSSDLFISESLNYDYYIQSNITTTTFTISSSLTHFDTYYYWRVFAYNLNGDSKLSSSTNSFYLKAPVVEEVEFDIGEADDWTLHSVGSRADISVDNSNFFGNDEKSLKIAFKEEDTNRGVPLSDGWIVVTRTVERSVYGTDALYFNMYYSGQDANILIRVVDRDNEYWYQQVQISNNAKQSVIMKFGDFIQRTNDVPVANQIFDYQRIKYLEIVFEKSFGDGLFLISGLKAIKFSNYKDQFIDKLNFENYSEDRWTSESYNFEREINGTELTIKYYGSTDGGKEKINGYGFAKLNVNQYLLGGDAIKMSVKYTGTPSKNSEVVLRIYEEDTDRWSYTIPFSVLTEDEYFEIVIPYAAFAKSQTTGDGKRQFYYLLNIQFGLRNTYATGTLSFKDFEIVDKANYISETTRAVGADGVIEDFDNYITSANLYMIWQTSVNNKDEYMSINNTSKIGGNKNPYCGQFEYKSDMEPAEYGIEMSTNSSFSALSLWLKDKSERAQQLKYNHIENWSPEAIVRIYLKTGEIYKYSIESVEKAWYNYVLPFTIFEIENRDSLPTLPSPISSIGIAGVSISFKYFYYDYKGNPSPAYSNNNAVLIDSIKLTDDVEQQKILKDKVVTTEDNVSLIDDFEDYADTSEMLDFWTDGFDYDYQNMELSNEVSSEGGNNSIKMQYKTKNDSVAYYIAPNIISTVEGRAIRVSIKGTGSETIYVNIYLLIGTSSLHYRATITNASSDWTEYTIGFSNFKLIESTSSKSLTSKDLIYVSRVSFGMVNNTTDEEELRYVYVDNIKFDSTPSYSTNTTRKID